MASLEILRLQRDRHNEEQAERDKRKNKRNDDNSTNKASAALLIPGSEAVSFAGSTSAVAKAQIANAISRGAMKKAAQLSTQQQMTALGAATARVKWMVDAGAAYSSFARVAVAVTAAMATIGPFAVLAVSEQFGFNTANDVTAKASTISTEEGELVASAIFDEIAATTQTGNSIYLDPDTIADAIRTNFDLAAASGVALVNTQHAGATAPLDLSTTGVSIDENTTGIVGVLSGLSGDAGGITWKLISGEGFAIEGDKLVVTKPFDFEAQQTATVIVEASNHAGWTSQFEIIVNVVDVDDNRSLTVSWPGDFGPSPTISGEVTSIERLGYTPFDGSNIGTETLTLRLYYADVGHVPTVNVTTSGIVKVDQFTAFSDHIDIQMTDINFGDDHAPTVHINIL